MLEALAIASVATQSILISNVSVIEPGSNKPLNVRSVLIQDGTFRPFSAATKLPPNIRRIDGKGKFLIPGLWDMHVHWYDEKSLGLFTANGVTGIRIMFGNEAHKTWRARANSEGWVGPRVVTAGPIVDGKKPFWPGSISYDDPSQAASIVQRHKRDDWDFLKAYSLLRREPYFALMKSAKNAGFPVCGHVPLTVTLLEAAEAGHRSNEHLDGFMIDLRPDATSIRKSIDEALTSGKSVQDALSILATMPVIPRATDAQVSAYGEKLAKAGMWQCPTLVVSKSLAYLDKPDLLNDARLKYIPGWLKTRWNPKNDDRFKNNTEEDWSWARKEHSLKMSFIKPLKMVGTRFLAGTDCLNPYCFPGFSLHDELALLVEAGLTPSEALETATVNPARYFGMDGQLGSIRSGFRADCVLLDKNPLIDIKNTTLIRAVIQNGKLYDRRNLDAMLSSNVQK